MDYNDWEQLAPLFATLESEPLGGANVPGWLSRWSDLLKNLREANAGAHRAKDENTADKAAEARYLHILQEITPRADEANQRLRTKLLAVADFLPAPEHGQMLLRMRNEVDLFRAENVPLLAQVATRANDYYKITGAMSVELNGETLTMPQARQKLQEPDRAVREAAWRAFTNRFLLDKDALDTLLLDLLPVRQQIARNAGLPDFRAHSWRRLNRFAYSPNETLALHDSVEKEFVPILRGLHEQRKKQMGLSALRPWDLGADPDGRPPLRPFADTDELKAGAQQVFAQINPVFGTQWQAMRDGGYLDLASRANKSPGGYCMSFPVSQKPYIFMNAVGSQGDLNTLLHEAGHAFHGFACFANQELSWNLQYPMEFAEVASMAMELLATPYLGKDEGGFYAEGEAKRATNEHLSGLVSTLCFTCLYDALQHWLYTTKETVTPAVLDAKVVELEERFSPGVDWSGLETERGANRLRVLHIFVLPFYMIEYTIAQLGALQIGKSALETGYAQATEKYRAALALGGSRSLPDLFAAAGAELAFDRARVAPLARFVAQRLEATI